MQWFVQETPNKQKTSVSGGVSDTQPRGLHRTRPTVNVRSAIQQGFEHQGKSIYNIKTKAMQTTVRYMTGNLEIPEISILETLEKSSHLSTSFSLHLLHRIRTSCHLQGLGLYLGTAHRCIPKPTPTNSQGGNCNTEAQTHMELIMSWE